MGVTRGRAADRGGQEQLIGIDGGAEAVNRGFDLGNKDCSRRDRDLGPFLIDAVVGVEATWQKGRSRSAARSESASPKEHGAPRRGRSEADEAAAVPTRIIGQQRVDLGDREPHVLHLAPMALGKLTTLDTGRR